MTTRVMVTTNGTAYEAHVYVERRDERGHFIRDAVPVKVRGHEHGQGFAEVWLPDDAQIVVSEHRVEAEHEGAAS